MKNQKISDGMKKYHSHQKMKRIIKKGLSITIPLIIAICLISEYSERTNAYLGSFKEIDMVECKRMLKEVEQSTSTANFNKNITLREVTAYNVGDVEQCDDTPCISANGEDICKALELGFKRCATNAFEFGTVLKIQNYGECVVVDRMNSRYSNRIDIAMKLNEKQRALNFGLQVLEVEVIKK